MSNVERVQKLEQLLARVVSRKSESRVTRRLEVVTSVARAEPAELKNEPVLLREEAPVVVPAPIEPVPQPIGEVEGPVSEAPSVAKADTTASFERALPPEEKPAPIEPIHAEAAPSLPPVEPITPEPPEPLKVEPVRVEVPQVEIPKVEVPRVEVPKVEAPAVIAEEPRDERFETPALPLVQARVVSPVPERPRGYKALLGRSLSLRLTKP